MNCFLYFFQTPAPVVHHQTPAPVPELDRFPESERRRQPLHYVSTQESQYNATLINPLYTGILFQSYMLDESICHFRGGGSI